VPSLKVSCVILKVAAKSVQPIAALEPVDRCGTLRSVSCVVQTPTDLPVKWHALRTLKHRPLYGWVLKASPMIVER
jgi:hypothetical protein